MPTPYEFGQRVGHGFEKEARGILADMALYSNPFTGVPTAAYDTYNHLRGGRYLNALGSVAAGGLSLAGGGLFGSGVKGLGNAALRAGTRLGTQTAVGGGLASAGTALRVGGRAIGAAAAPMTRAFQGMNNAAGSAIQKVLPTRAGATFTTAPLRTATNWVGKNPLEAGALFLHNGSHTAPTPPPAMQPR